MGTSGRAGSATGAAGRPREADAKIWHVTGPPDDELRAARVGTASVVEDLRAELAAIGESTAASPDDEHDAEGSTVAYERARVRALLQSAEAALARIDAALERREAGRYGSCTDCGAAIPAERQLALPGVSRCAGCAARAVRRPWRPRTSRRPL